MAESYNMLMDVMLKQQNDLDGIIDAYKDLKNRKSKPDQNTHFNDD